MLTERKPVTRERLLRVLRRSIKLGVSPETIELANRMLQLPIKITFTQWAHDVMYYAYHNPDGTPRDPRDGTPLPSTDAAVSLSPRGTNKI